MTVSWLILQLSDSAFPTGGFAHSGGLEAALQQREVENAEDVKRFLHEWLAQHAHGQLPFMSSAHREPAGLERWNAAAEAFLTNHVVRRASRLQGQAFFETTARVFPSVEALRAADKSFHHAPVFGAVLGTLGVPIDDAQRMFLSIGLRGVLSAAVRLNALGTHEAQSTLHALSGPLERAWSACRNLTASDATQTAPLMDLFAATHDRLYSRLFLS